MQSVLPIALAACSVLSVVAAQEAGLQQRTRSEARAPNIVLVLADDLGYGDPGCYNDASKVPTPHLDRLAAQGLRLTDAHSPSSVCTPTRYGILTGRYAWRTALKSSVLWPWDPSLIEPERATLPELLAAAGYDTACIGKWHLGFDWPLVGGGHVRDEYDGVHVPAAKRRAIGERIDFTKPLAGGPLAHGFAHYFGDDVPNFPPYGFIEDDRMVMLPTVEKPAGMFGAPGPAVPGWDLSVVLPTLAQRAANWIDRQARAGAQRPFFLYVPLTSPHTPIAPSPHWVGKSEAGAYGDWVAETDGVLGAVLDALERGALSDDTLVVFTSDNGSPARDGSGMSGPQGAVKTRYGHDPSRPWRGIKGDIYEGGHRVPCVVRWPGQVPPSSVSDAPVVLTDLFRSLLQAAGVAVPEDAGEDSFDQLAHWRNPGAPPVRDHVVHHSFHGVFAIRSGPWKLILGKGSGGFTRIQIGADAPAGQLYHLEDDPGERDNRFAAEPDVVEQLRSRLQAVQSAGRSAPR